jgi:acyl carrier protein
MGLDIVEFVIAVEGSFGIDIPDKDAESLETPRLLIEYLGRHLATYGVAAMRDPNAAWTRQEIETRIVNLIESELGVDMTKHTLDSRFIRDMGLD